MGKSTPSKLSTQERVLLCSSLDGLIIKRDISLNRFLQTRHHQLDIDRVLTLHESYEDVIARERRLVWAIDHSRSIATGELKVYLG